MPAKRSVETSTPRTPGARQVAIDGDRFVFVARGHLVTEPVAGGAAEALATGVVDAVWSQPSVCATSSGKRVVGLRIDTRGAPALPKTVDVVDGPSVKAHAYGCAARAPIVVAFDVKTGDVRTIDLASNAVSDVVKLATKQDPQVPGPVSVNDDGTRALVMVSGSAHGDAALHEIDLAAKTHARVHGPVSKGAVCGTWWGKQLVVCEHSAGDDTKLRVFLGGKLIFERAGMHPHSVPVPISDAHMAIVLVPQVDEITGTGDPHVCLLDKAGTFTQLAPVDGARVRTDGNAIVVEGGRSVTRVVLA
jgi:hypothetical protein